MNAAARHHLERLEYLDNCSRSLSAILCPGLDIQAEQRDDLSLLLGLLDEQRNQALHGLRLALHAA